MKKSGEIRTNNPLPWVQCREFFYCFQDKRIIMNFRGIGIWRIILAAVCCVIIIAGAAILFTGPSNGFFSGTCGPDEIPMNYSTDIQPEFELSFLYEFGEPEPGQNLSLPVPERYTDRQTLIDTLMDKAQISESPDSVIGLYEFPDARLLLVNRNTGVTEVLETGDTIRVFIPEPVNVGSRTYEINGTDGKKRGDYNFSYEHSVGISRIDLVYPAPGNETVPLYIVNKTRIEKDFYPDGRVLATIRTTGIFYVLYGQRVERVTGITAIVLDPEWQECSPRTEISGEGSMTGEMKYTVKLARSSERMLWSHLITTSAYIQHHDTEMGSSTQWESRDSTGCDC